MNREKMLADLLTAWEETYKKGQLTLWIFLALRKEHQYVEDIKSFIEHYSEGSMHCEDQSLYRNLRKFQYLGVVDFTPGKGNKGPERKYYFLTDLGNSLFNQFIHRNIRLFYQPEIMTLIKTEETR